MDSKISVSEKLYADLKKISTNAGFDNVEEYVRFALEEIVKNENESSKSVSSADKKEIEDRLRKLGYK